MERSVILAQLKELISENLELEVPDQLEDGHRIYDDLNIDSIMVLQLVVYIEENFGVSIPEEGVDPSVYETVGALVDFIQQLQKAAV
ncbi:Acyl carrier protein [compost metagenome]